MSSDPLPDLVVGDGAPPVGVRPQWLSGQARVNVLAATMLVGPVALAFVLRLVTGEGTPWAYTMGLLLASIPILLAAGWATESAGRRQRAGAASVIHPGEPEAWMLRYAIGLALAGAADSLAAAAFEPWIGAAVFAALVAWIAFCAVTPQRRLRTGWTLEVTATPEAAFAFVADVRHWPLYWPGLTVLDPIPEETRLGTTFRFRYSKKAVVEGEDQAVEYLPGRRMSFMTLKAFPNRSTYSFDLIPGGSRITYTYESVRNLGAMVMGNGFRRRHLLKEFDALYREMTSRLKPLLESSSPPAV
jgi:hypothetical protein